MGLQMFVWVVVIAILWLFATCTDGKLQKLLQIFAVPSTVVGAISNWSTLVMIVEKAPEVVLCMIMSIFLADVLFQGARGKN